MSTYTTTVRWIVDTLGKPYFTPETKTIHQKIQAACPVIFNFDFPIWDENHRLALETGILRHYYMREIAFETVGLWQFFLEQDLNEIMPYYNKLYQTTNKDYDYLNDTYIQETFERGITENTSNENHSLNNVTGHQSASTQGQNQGNSLSSDLPQATINPNIDYANRKAEDSTTSQLQSNTYTSSGTHSDGSGKYARGLKEQTKLSRIGNQGGKSQTELLMQFRKSIIVVDSLIINQLSNLFFNLY